MQILLWTADGKGSLVLFWGWFPDRRTAPDGWPYAAVLYCALDEPGRYQSHTGMGKRNDLVSDFPGSVLQRDTGKKRRWYHTLEKSRNRNKRRKIRRKSGRDPSEIIVSAGTWDYRYLSESDHESRVQPQIWHDRLYKNRSVFWRCGYNESALQRSTWKRNPHYGRCSV